jgi:hypothetical protein
MRVLSNVTTIVFSAFNTADTIAAAKHAANTIARDYFFFCCCSRSHHGLLWQGQWNLTR